MASSSGGEADSLGRRREDGFGGLRCGGGRVDSEG